MSRTTSTRPSSTMPPAARRERLTLLSFTGPEATKRVTTAQASLEAAYLKARKRKLPVDLFIGSTGPREKAIITLAAHYTPEQREDVWLLQREAEALQKVA